MYKILNVTTGLFIMSRHQLSPGKGYHIYRDPSDFNLSLSDDGFYECRFFTKFGAWLRLMLSFKSKKHLYIILKV